MSDSTNNNTEQVVENVLNKDVSRRGFVKTSGAAIGGAAALSMLPVSGCSDGSSSGALNLAKLPPLFSVKPTNSFDGYRDKWTWDNHVKGTHTTNCWFQMSCAFNVYTKDGKVIREEQSGTYPQTNPNVPDFNPRGCQKGCSYGQMIYNEARIKKPLRRKGERGGGQWEEVSWDVALTEIADKMIDAIDDYGTESVVIDLGTNIVGSMVFETVMRFGDTLDSTLLDMNTEIGDDQQGAVLTYGEIAGERSADDFFNSDLIVLWGGNPAYTQIPNIHFIHEARYNGAKFLAINPDMNASSIHADLWVPIKPGTDAALAMGLCKIIMDGGHVAEDVIKEQTDLPCLVRVDNGKLLREIHLKKRGSDEQLYCFNEATQKIEEVNQNTLELNGVNPSLNGEYEIETLDGMVKVTPAYQLLKKQLEDFPVEVVSEITGIAPKTIHQVANMMIKSKAMANITSSSLSKLYHGDGIMRSQILVFLLLGHVGKPGAGFTSCSELFADAQVNIIKDLQIIGDLKWTAMKDYIPRMVKDFFKGRNVDRTVADLMGKAFLDSRLLTNSTLFWNIHGGVYEVSGRDWDKTLKRPLNDYVEEALGKDWQVLTPGVNKQPRVLFSSAGNLLRRVRSAHKIQEVLWPKLDLIVATELRMSSTAMYSDYILPVSSAYEKATSFVFNTSPVTPYLHTTVKAIENVGESKDEWELHALLMKKIQQRAIERGVKTFTTRHGKVRPFDNVYDIMTYKGRINENDCEKLTENFVHNSTNLSDATYEEMKEKGFVKFSSIGLSPVGAGQASDWRPDETITPFTFHVEHKEVWPTLSGRIQFYIDHDWYIELEETLPNYKIAPKSGGDYPIVMTGGHNRWSIHSTQRTDKQLLRLQQGQPCMWLSKEDSEARGIANGDRIEVMNDVGTFITRAKISASVRPGQAVMYHAWENFQFENGMGYRNVQASPIKPLELVGDAAYMKPQMAIRQPGGNDRDTRIEIRRLSS